MIFAVLPVKNPRNAKQRLKGFLSPEQREEFARVMYEHTLSALRQARGIDKIVIITNDSAAAAHARLSGVMLFEEREQVSHSASADSACRRAIDLGATTVILVPIDVPLATPTDFEQLAAASKPGVIIVPSADGTGTNALVRTPPDVIESRFGTGSFRAHLEQAQARGVATDVLRVPGLMFDIDTPDDIAELLAQAPESRAARFLQIACGSR